jgi:subtilisin family serine protease
MEDFDHPTFPTGYREAPAAPRVQTTGRLLVLTRLARRRGRVDPTAASLKEASAAFARAISVEVAHSSDFGPDWGALGRALSAVSGSTALMLDKLGVAIVESHEDWEGTLSKAAADRSQPIACAEKERVVRASSDYLQGYQDAVNHLAESIRAGGYRGDPGALALPGGPFADDARHTWGLKAVGADVAAVGGGGARVAVLDTGVDAGHPDLVAAIEAAVSFVAGESADDGNGHGTHVAGTVAGRAVPDGVPRFGVAPDARLFCGKVLGSDGMGSDATILAGLEWAISNGCHVASLSLGASVPAGTPHSAIFEQVARSALAGGTIIVAAAGNDSRRPASVSPISHPANCPSIVAVAALDTTLRPAAFSNAGRVGEDHIAIAGPGVAVLSSVPGGDHAAYSGTSMATPHVAGVAAAIQGSEGVTGAGLVARLLMDAEALLSPAVDVGTGLAHIPVA